MPVASEVKLTQSTAANVSVRANRNLKLRSEVLSQVETVQRRNVAQILQDSIVVVESRMPDADAGKLQMPPAGKVDEQLSFSSVRIHNRSGCCDLMRGNRRPVQNRPILRHNSQLGGGASNVDSDAVPGMAHGCGSI